MPTAHGEDRVIRFGGVRNVVVIISDSADRYRIVVNMLAVKAFDPATNKRLNLQKARAIAIKALAKHAAMKNGAPFTVRGMEVQDMTTANGSYRLVLLLPKENIAAIAVERPKPPSPEKGGFNENQAPPAAAQRAGKTERPSGQKKERLYVDEDSSAAALLTRAADYLDTLAQLKEGVLEDLNAVQKKVLHQDDFYLAISELEERLDRLCRSMEAEINADNLLLSTEQRELRQVMKKQRSEVMKALKAAVEQFDARQEKKKKKKEEADQ